MTFSFQASENLGALHAPKEEVEGRVGGGSGGGVGGGGSWGRMRVTIIVANMISIFMDGHHTLHTTIIPVHKAGKFE